MANKEFSKTLKKLRINAGYSQKQVYKHFNIPQSTFSSWEVGKSEPSGEMLLRLCKFYNCDMMKEFPNSENILFANLELETIKKYRALDEYGRETVNIILNRETERVKMLGKKVSELTAQAEQIIELKKASNSHYYISYYQHLASAGSGEYLFDNIPCDTIAVPVTKLSKQADFAIGVNGSSMEPTYHDGDKVYVEISKQIPTGSIGIFTRGNECFIKELGVDRLISHNPDKGRYPDIPASEDIRCVGLVLGHD